MKKIVIFLMIASLAGYCWGEEDNEARTGKSTNPIPRSEVPADQMAYFGLKGPVAEVVQHDYGYYTKYIWRFDKQQRLVEYTEFGSPFAGDGGCVFRLMKHYRYAYDDEGQIIFLETYDEDYNLVDEYADLTLELFPSRGLWLTKPDRAEREFGGTTWCDGAWTETDEGQMHYRGVQFDAHGNWIAHISENEDKFEYASVSVREIKYYKDIELLDLQPGVKEVQFSTKDEEGHRWHNSYKFDREGALLHFQSWKDEEALFEWSKQIADGDAHVPESEDADEGTALIVNNNDWRTVRKVTFYEPEEVFELPEDFDPELTFDMIVDYKGYAMECNVWPLHNGYWMVTSYWSLDLEETIFMEDENGEMVPARTFYKDPFEGKRYPIVPDSCVCFGTRNYGGQEMKFYNSPTGKRVWDKLDVECELHALDADPKTRRILCRTEPFDGTWDERPYKSVYGWVDEEWLCANLLTTCP